MIKLKNILLSASIMSVFFGSYAVAENTPISRGIDSRIQYIQYNPDDVVLVKTKAGIATHIVLNPDETYQNHAFGDSEAWNFAEYNNSVFIKPKELDGNTNLIILTDKRTYNFYLEVTKTKTFEVKFIYPDEEKSKQKAQFLANNTDYQLNQLKNRFSGKKINLAYKIRGSKDISPINIWDDGTFTYFKFGANTDIPAIYYISENGKENLYNRTTLGITNNIIMMHGIGKKWRLRIGDSSVDVLNDALNKVGNEMESGTVTDKVKREIIN